MKTYILLVALAVATLFPNRTHARETDLKPFILMPYKFAAWDCNNYKGGPEMLRAAILGAQTRSGKLLPSSFWNALLASIIPSSQEPNDAIKARCMDSISLFSNPTFTANIRGTTALLISGPLVMRCLAFQPAKSNALKPALLAAFKRNGFELSGDGVDQSVALTKENKSNSAPTTDQCESTLVFVSGQEFDAAYSEAGVERFFVDP